MTIEQQIAALTTATTDLLDVVKVKKATLDTAVSDASSAAIATAADRVQTGLDAAATAADRVQTGLDRTQTENFYQLTNDNKILATEAATQAQLWAEGEEPGGPGTRSAKAWVESIPPIIGVPGSYMSISTDPDNRLTTGSDAGLYVPELTVDPLAYYIISKS